MQPTSSETNEFSRKIKITEFLTASRTLLCILWSEIFAIWLLHLSKCEREGLATECCTVSSPSASLCTTAGKKTNMATERLFFSPLIKTVLHFWRVHFKPKSPDYYWFELLDCLSLASCDRSLNWVIQVIILFVSRKWLRIVIYHDTSDNISATLKSTPLI